MQTSHIFIFNTFSKDVKLQIKIAKHYISLRRYKLSGIFILWILLKKILSKFALYKHNYNKLKNIRVYAMPDIYSEWLFPCLLYSACGSVLAGASVC